MKKIGTLLCFLLGSYHLFAQFSHRVDSTEIIAGTYTDLNNNGQIIATDIRGLPLDSATSTETWSSAQQIGFPFRFAGKTYTHFYLSTNGFITLDTAVRLNVENNMNRIAVFSTVLDKGGPGAYRVFTSGIAGSRICTIQFRNLNLDVTWNNDPNFHIYDTINCQIRLYEGTDYIDLVYGHFVASQPNLIAFATAYVRSGQRSTHVSKSPDVAWELAAFFRSNDLYNGGFGCNTDVLPVPGTTYRFRPNTQDVGLTNIYMLGKQPATAGQSSTMQVRVRNYGATVAPTYHIHYSLGSQFITLSPYADTIISFPHGFTERLGYREIQLQSYFWNAFDDDTLANNSLLASQEITADIFSHADTTAATGAFNQPGLVLARYKMYGTAPVNRVMIRIGAGSIGTPVHAVVLNASGAIVGTSPTRNITAADINTDMLFNIDNPPSISDTNFYVGLAQTGNVAIATQAEYPVRPGAFFTAAIGGGVLTELTSAGKLMIQAGLLMNQTFDLDLTGIAAYKKIPIQYLPYGTAQGIVINNSTEQIRQLPATLTIDGTRIIDSSAILDSVAAGDIARTRKFNPYYINELGNKTLRVSIPADADNSNNSATFIQTFTQNEYAAADTTMPYEPGGFGSASGIALVYYPMQPFNPALGSNPRAYVKQVKVHISSDPANVGEKVRAVLMVANGLCYSDPYIIQPADLNQYKIFTINDPLAIPSMGRNGPQLNFYVGLQQFGNGIASYNPVSIHPNIPFSSYTLTSYDASGNPILVLDINGNPVLEQAAGDYLIEAILSPGDWLYNEWGYRAGPLAEWNFSAGSSPATGNGALQGGLAPTPLMTRGAGAAASAGSEYFQTSGFGNDGLHLNSTDYFQIQLSPDAYDANNQLSLEKIVYDPRGDSLFAAGAGVRSQFAYSLNGVDFTWIGSPATTMSGVQPAPGYVDLSGIAALKGIPVGTTVTIRYYASGQTTNGQWGFGANGLEVYGTLASSYIWVDPVRPAGADFVFNGCARDTPTTIHFTLYGRGQAGRVFTAKLLRLVGTHEDPNVDGGIRNDYTIVADIGTLVSDSISGTILCRIPDAPDGTYVIGVSYDSTVLFDHYSSYSCQFAIRHTGLVEYRFTGNGNWSDPANWLNGFVPPLVIPCGVEVIITTTGSGSCIVNGNITVMQGGLLTITPGSRVEVRP